MSVMLVDSCLFPCCLEVAGSNLQVTLAQCLGREENGKCLLFFFLVKSSFPKQQTGLKMIWALPLTLEGEGSGPLYPHRSPYVALSRNVGVRPICPLLCLHVSMSICAIDIKEKVVMVSHYMKDRIIYCLILCVGTEYLSFQSAIQSHSCHLLSRWLCHWPFAAKPSILITLCKSEDNIQTLFDQSGFVFIHCLHVCMSLHWTRNGIWSCNAMTVSEGVLNHTLPSQPGQGCQPIALGKRHDHLPGTAHLPQRWKHHSLFFLTSCRRSNYMKEHPSPFGQKMYS